MDRHHFFRASSASGMLMLSMVMLVILVCSNPLAGQQAILKFDRLSTENTLTVKGLSQNSVYCLKQDSKGFIWIGTWDGLNKYDGYDFMVYNTANGLSNPTINSLLEDEENNIWIATDEGLNILNRNTGEITLFTHDPANPNSLCHNQTTFLFQDSKNFIWISTAFGLNRYDKGQHSFTQFNFFEKGADSSFCNYITRVKEDGKGRIWIATHRGIHCYDPLSQDFKYYKIDRMIESPDFLRSNYIQDIVIDNSDLIYAATLNGVFLIEPDFGVIKHLSSAEGYIPKLSGNNINALMIDLKGQIWIGTAQGLDVFNPSTGKIASYKAGSNIFSLSNEDIRSLFQDQAGTIWIGTYKGLNKVVVSPSRFSRYTHEPDNPNSLSDNIVYSVVEDEKGLIWVATYDGVNIYDRTIDRFSFLLHDPDNLNSLSSNKIRSLSIDSSGYIWVGTESEGMNRINRKTGEITHFRHVSNDSLSLAEDNILASYVDSRGRIWVGTVSKGVSIFDPKNEKWMTFSANPGSKVRISDNKVWTIYESQEGNIWLGTGNGLNKLATDLNSVIIFSNDPTNSNTLSNDRILSIYEDKEGIFWIGTMGGGLNRFDPVSGNFSVYTEKDGLPNDVIYASLEDDKGNLWLTSNRGITRFNKIDGTFVNYDTKDGVQGNEFNAGAYFKNKDGEIIFGGMNGINIFHPDEITLNLLPPRMAFTGFRVLNDLLRTDLENGEIIRLNYNENFFSIEFSALDFTNPPKNLYKYKLSNYDDDWILTSANQRKADYRKVDPGSYRFTVTGSNNDGVWNTQGISLTLVIKPPWWQNWFFRLSMIIFIVALVWGTVLLRLRAIRKKHSVEKKMLSIEKQIFELEQKALRLQMNPHFIFNSLNAIQNFVLANDTDKAVNYLAKFSHLMRMILANSTAALITLKDELKALTYYIDLEKLRFDDRFDYIIIRDPSIDEEFIEIPPMLFQPYVENAIIHGLVNSKKHGLLEITIKRLDSVTMLCSIKDNGIGREKAIEIRNKSGIKRQPRGMIITQERIEIFNKQNRKNFSVRITDLKDEDGSAAGTLVEFTIQYKET